jgi:baculoviral IAP repeat-containing protein 6
MDELAGFHYHANLTRSAMTSHVKSRIRRLAQEHADLSHSLPLSLSSTVWLRASAERMDALQFMISGPEDTPYSNGLFIFDAYFPDRYPVEVGVPPPSTICSPNRNLTNDMNFT